MPMPDVFQIRRGWLKSPPTHWLAAMFIGYKPKGGARKATRAAPVASEDDLDALIKEVNG